MAKMQITFPGFADMAQRLDRMGGDLKTAVTEALEETQKIVEENLRRAAEPYQMKGGGLKGKATGAMYRKIMDNLQVNWKGDIAEISVGFDLEKAGFHSIFVMYGTPKMSKDTKVYNAIRGSETRKQIEKAQQEIMQKYLTIAG